MIYLTSLITDYDPDGFQGALNNVVARLQEQGLEVEIQFSTAKGTAATTYSALVIAKKPS